MLEDKARYQLKAALWVVHQAMRGMGIGKARTAAGKGAAGRFKDAIARHLAAAGELLASRHAACQTPITFASP